MKNQVVVNHKLRTAIKAVRATKNATHDQRRAAMVELRYWQKQRAIRSA